MRSQVHVRRLHLKLRWSHDGCACVYWAPIIIGGTAAWSVVQIIESSAACVFQPSRYNTTAIACSTQAFSQYYTAGIFQDLGSKDFRIRVLSLSHSKHMHKIDGVVQNFGRARTTIDMLGFRHVELRHVGSLKHHLSWKVNTGRSPDRFPYICAFPISAVERPYICRSFGEKWEPLSSGTCGRFSVLPRPSLIQHRCHM